MGQVLSKLKRVIKERDEYGHKVVLNFNQDGDTFKTAPGGFISILINLTVIAYTVF